MQQNYGVLRVVLVRPPANATTALQDKYPAGWLPEERLVHVLTRRETTIGRALSNDIILLDPTVSREHARLVLAEDGWHIINLTAQNIVRVNGQPVPGEASLPMQSQDILILGSTMLQLIAPQHHAPEDKEEITLVHLPHPAMPDQRDRRVGWQGEKPRAASNSISIEKGRSSKVSSPGTPSHIAAQPRPATRQPGLGTGKRDCTNGVDRHAGLAPVSIQADPELVAQPWGDDEEESVLGAGVTMQFALPQRMGIRTRWLIAGVGVTILAVSATITIVLNSLIGFSALAHDGVTSVLAALTIPLVPAVGIGLLVNFMDRYEREPWFLRLAAFLWGAVIAIPPAFFIERKVDGALQVFLGPYTNDVVRTMLQGLNAGVTEETVKGLGLLLLFIILRDQFDNVTDGIVYGALIGAGFAMVENFGYFAIGSRQFLVFLIVGRVILGWLGHSTFTVCFGAALGYVRHTRVRWRQIVIPLAGYLVAVGLHSFFDFVDFQASAAVLAAPGNSNVAWCSLIAIIGDYIPPFLAQMVLLSILIKSLAHEAAVIREFLAAEVSNGVVSVEEYALLQNSFQRTKQERRVLRESGIRQWRRIKALYQTEIGLAFRKWHVSMGDKPKLGYRQPEDAYRQRIKRWRNEIRGK